MRRWFILIGSLTLAGLLLAWWSNTTTRSDSPMVQAPLGESPASGAAKTPTTAENTASAQPAPSPSFSKGAQTSSEVTGRDLSVPRQPTHLDALDGIKRTFRDPAKAEAFVALLDETCALEQEYALQDASVRAEYMESIAARQPPVAALEASRLAEVHLAKLVVQVDRQMALLPHEGPDRAPFRTDDFKKLLADQCPSVMLEAL